MRDRDEGFTLIELLVVMIIIGLLAGIAIPVFLSQRNKAKDTSAKNDVTTIALEVNSALVPGAATLLTIDSTNGVYKIAGTDANNDPVLTTGNLSPGNQVAAKSKYYPSTNTFCVEVDTASGGKWKYDTTASGSGTVQAGACA